MFSWLAIQSTWKAKNGPFTVLGWLTRAHTQQCARNLFWTRVYHATAQGHSAVQVNRCHRRSSIGCRLAALPNQRAVTERPKQLTQSSYLAIFGGSRRGLGDLSRTQHSVLQAFS